MPQYLRDQSFWKDETGTARLPQTLISLPIHDKELTTEKHFVSNFSTAVLNFCNSQRLHELSTLKILDISIFLGFSSFLTMYLSALLTEKIPVYLVSKFEIAIDCELWQVCASTDQKFTHINYLGEKTHLTKMYLCLRILRDCLLFSRD